MRKIYLLHCISGCTIANSTIQVSVGICMIINRLRWNSSDMDQTGKTQFFFFLPRYYFYQQHNVLTFQQHSCCRQVQWGPTVAMDLPDHLWPLLRRQRVSGCAGTMCGCLCAAFPMCYLACNGKSARGVCVWYVYLCVKYLASQETRLVVRLELPYDLMR